MAHIDTITAEEKADELYASQMGTDKFNQIIEELHNLQAAIDALTLRVEALEGR